MGERSDGFLFVGALPGGEWKGGKRETKKYWGKDPIELNPEIGCLDVVIAEERLARPLIGYLARFKHISSIGYQKGLFYILFHNENGCPFFIDLFYRIEDISHEKRCKSEGRLVKHLEFG